MFIIWGTKSTAKQLGHVADFCLFCRETQQVSVLAKQSYRHIYFLPVGRQNHHGHEARCCNCRMKWTVDASNYTGFSKRTFPHLEMAVQETNPQLSARLRGRMRLEKAIVDGDIGVEERQLLLKEPFDVLTPMIEERYAGETRIDRGTILSVAATLTMTVALGFTAASIPSGGLQEALTAAAFLALQAGLFISFMLFFSTNMRYLNRYVYPALANNLRPLQPTAAELTAILDKFRVLRWKAGTKLKPRKILTAIECSASP